MAIVGFGQSVAAHGNHVVIGAPGTSNGGITSGAALVYTFGLVRGVSSCLK